jgi:hypothetical protein
MEFYTSYSVGLEKVCPNLLFVLLKQFPYSKACGRVVKLKVLRYVGVMNSFGLGSLAMVTIFYFSFHGDIKIELSSTHIKQDSIHNKQGSKWPLGTTLGVFC